MIARRPSSFARLTIQPAARSAGFAAAARKVWAWLTGASRFHRLPILCGARDPSNNQPIAIWRGEKGYFLWTESKSPEECNKDHQISTNQVEAMLEGSVMGWRGNMARADELSE